MEQMKRTFKHLQYRDRIKIEMMLREKASIPNTAPPAAPRISPAMVLTISPTMAPVSVPVTTKGRALSQSSLSRRSEYASMVAIRATRPHSTISPMLHTADRPMRHVHMPM